MAAWHVEEGGVLTDYEIEKVVALLQHGNWSDVETRGAQIGIENPEVVIPEWDAELLVSFQEPNPHECVSCHEEPELHAERFGVQCANCHDLVTWLPARLIRHAFPLDHGDAGQQPCQACHIESYVAYTCYECHDHQPAEVEVAHIQEEIEDLNACSECHPTGAPGEAEAGVRGKMKVDVQYQIGIIRSDPCRDLQN